MSKHDERTCERNLKARPDYSPFRGTPAVFVCECGRRFEYHDDESEGASWFRTNFCETCDDTGIMRGGWMGPTRDAPWPRPCTCDVGRAMTPRDVQLKVMELVQRDLDSGRPIGERGWFAETYAPLLGLDDWQHDAEPFDIGDQDLATYVNDLDETVLVTREGFDPPWSAVAGADVWKVLTRNGVAVKKHRDSAGDYFECGDDRAPFGVCTKPRNHPGAHYDDHTGRSWG